MNQSILALLAATLLSIAVVPVRIAKCADALDDKIEESAKLAQAQNDADHERGMIALDAILKELEDSKAEKDGAAEARRLFLLGKTEYYLDRQDEAATYLDKAVGVAPAVAEYQFFRGQSRAMNGDPVGAEGDLINATRLAPKEPRYWYALGLCQARSEKNDEATADFRKTLAIDPKNAKATFMIGAVLYKQEKSNEALAMFQKAADLDPTLALAYANMGQIYQNQGKHAESLQAYRKLLKIQPDDGRAQAKIIQCEQALGLMKERDVDRAAMAKLHAEGKFQDEFYCRDQFSVGKTKLIVFEYFELKGERPVRYSFDVLADSGDKLQYKITLGSPESDNQIARELGQIGKNDRVYFLDAEYPDGEHRSYGSTDKIEPTYDDTKKQVIEIIEGKVEPVSSSKPGKAGGAQIKIK